MISHILAFAGGTVVGYWARPHIEQARQRVLIERAALVAQQQGVSVEEVLANWQAQEQAQQPPPPAQQPASPGFLRPSLNAVVNTVHGREPGPPPADPLNGAVIMTKDDLSEVLAIKVREVLQEERRGNEGGTEQS